MGYSAFAADFATVAVTTPLNATEYYSTTPFIPTITTSGLAVNCTMYIDNSTAILMLNGTDNTTWTNSSVISFNPKGVNSQRYFAFMCMNTTTTAWSNTTSTAGLQIFYINERAKNTITIADTRTNGSTTVLQQVPLVNITTNATAASCKYIFNQNGTHISMTNNSGVRTVYVNSSLPGLSGSLINDWNNLTYVCNDTFGNGSTSALTYFKLDLTNPAIANVNFPISNTTWNISTTRLETMTFYNNTAQIWPAVGGVPQQRAHGINSVSNVSDSFGTGNFTSNHTHVTLVSGEVVNGTYFVNYTYDYDIISSFPNGNFLNISFTVTDNNPYFSWVRVIKPDGTVSLSNATTINATTTPAVRMGINLTGTELSQNGLYYLEINTRDWASRNATASNMTVAISHLVANQYSPVVWYGNDTLGAVGGSVVNISSVSIYDNRIGYKNFTNYVVGLSTNAAIKLNASLNVTMILPNADLVLMRNYNSITFNTGTNTTLWTGGWNLIAQLNRVSLNNTIYATVYNNESRTTTNQSLTMANGTWVAMNNSNTAGSFNIISLTAVSNVTLVINSANYTFNSTHVKLQLSPPLNQTLPVFNWTYTWTYNFADASGANVTYISYFNNSLNKFCSAVRGWSITSCGSSYSITDVVPGQDSGIWILTNNNVTIDRSAIA